MLAHAALPRPAHSGIASTDSASWAPSDTVVREKRNTAYAAPGAPCSSPKRPSRHAEPESLLASLCAVVCNNQIGISVNLLLLLTLTHIFFPRARRRTAKFFHLAYYEPDSGLYGCGIDDVSVMALWVVIFTGLRVAVMEYLLDPFARYNGVKTKKGLVRFKEQAWLVLYCTFSWTMGMYIYYNSPFWLDFNAMWKGWPFREVTGLQKFYYLVQWAFYLQQILVVNIEEKRKDYWQMFTHHIFTTTLIFFSYGYFMTRVGTVILCIMDIIDIVLPVAKLLKYSGYSTACDYVFGLFVVVWFVTRHVLFPITTYSVYKLASVAIPNACYFTDGTVIYQSSTSEWEAANGHKVWSNLIKGFTDRHAPMCWNDTIRWSFLLLLLALQLIICLWFYTISKVVYKVIRGQAAEDERSDDEGEDDEVELDEEMANITHPISDVKSSHDISSYDTVPVEEEVGVEALNFPRKGSTGVKSYKRNSGRNSTSRTSGISIPGHGDRKELLGRIGCDKPT